MYRTFIVIFSKFLAYLRLIEQRLVSLFDSYDSIHQPYQHWHTEDDQEPVLVHQKENCHKAGVGRLYPPVQSKVSSVGAVVATFEVGVT